MFPLLLVLFTVLPVVELALLFQVGSQIGGWNTVILVLVTGVLGAGLARWQGLRTLGRIQEQLAQGQLPTAPLLDGALILVAGALLATPGVITDVVGLAFLLPPVRALVRRALRGWASGRVHTFTSVGFPGAQVPPPTSDEAGVHLERDEPRGERVVDVQAVVRDVEPSP